MEVSLWEQLINFAKTWFVYPGLSVPMLLAAIGLAIVFGGIWLSAHWPPLFKKPWLWAVAAGSAFLTMGAITFIQLPLQYWTGEALTHFWDNDTLFTWILLAGIPSVLISGLVQEGAKMVPMVVWWWRSGKAITPGTGLAIGAIAGAAFGVFQAFWAFGRVFGAGWTLASLQTDGFYAIAPFWERFFAIGFYAAVSALIGYGLAKGRGWQYFLIGGGLHTLFNYTAFFYRKGDLTLVWVETIIAVIAVVISVIVLLIRWRRRGDDTPATAEAPAPDENVPATPVPEEAAETVPEAPD